jgi:hypothetical protein
MKSKAQLGQFMTTRTPYILQGLNFPAISGSKVVEPFAGDLDLVKHYKLENVECYDIEPKHHSIIQRDTLTDPPYFRDKYILTNPPYLARNKSKDGDKTIYDKYKEDDLYKCFIRILLTNQCEGGILILPLNFLHYLRDFCNVYQITRMNVFEEQVFNDTTSSVCSFSFLLRKNSISPMSFIMTFFPSQESIHFLPSEENNYLLGGEIYNLRVANKRYKVKNGSSKILVKCIDDTELIGMKLIDENYIGKTSDRAYVSIVIEPPLPEEQQVKLVADFNIFFNNMRKKYRSMFLTSFREGSRKRIAFSLIYQIVEYILDSY